MNVPQMLPSLSPEAIESLPVNHPVFILDHDGRPALRYTCKSAISTRAVLSDKPDGRGFIYCGSIWATRAGVLEFLLICQREKAAEANQLVAELERQIMECRD